jgi:predicted ArsR family transcriptional regulator
MRTNKRKPVDSAAVTKAWAKVFDSMAVDDLDAYLADGWMTTEGIAKKSGIAMNTAKNQMARMAEAGKIEVKKIRAMTGKVIREINIYRPQT